MSNASAESPQAAIRRMLSTVDAIQSLFPDLWAPNKSDPEEAGDTKRDRLDSTWNGDQRQHSLDAVKQSSQTESSWPNARTINGTAPESSHRAISRIMSTVATNQLLFPELWDPTEKIPQGVLPDRFQVAFGSASIWNYNQQEQIQLPAKTQNDLQSFPRLVAANESEDEDSSDSGICSGNYLG